MKEGEYLQQLEVLLNLICRFKIQKTLDARTVRITMGWIPEGAKLILEYQDTWWFNPAHASFDGKGPGNPAGHTESITQIVDFGEGGVSLNEDRQFNRTLSKAPDKTTFFEAHFVARLQLRIRGFEFTIPPKPLHFDTYIGGLVEPTPW
jgi:hypothetical protein